MDWTNKLFSWGTTLSESQVEGGDRAQYFINYFGDGSVCGKVLLFSLIIALVMCIIYYLLCRFSFSFAKRRIWLIGVILVFLVSFFVNNRYITGSYDSDPDKNTGFFLSIDNTESECASFYESDPELEFQQHEIARILRDDLMTGEETLPAQIAFLTGLYAVIFYFFFSIVFKRYSVHGTAIPF